MTRTLPRDSAANDNHRDTQYRIVIASCTKRKRDELSPARLLYSPSAYFRKQRAYAEAVGDEWWIQSAEHGLVHPDDEIGPYDTRADQLDDLDGWAKTIATELWARRSTEATIELLGGAAYTDPLTPHLEERGFEVHEPLRGLAIGKRMQKLDELVVRRALA